MEFFILDYHTSEKYDRRVPDPLKCRKIFKLHRNKVLLSLDCSASYFSERRGIKLLKVVK